MFKLLLKYMFGFMLLGFFSVAVFYIISSKMLQHSVEQTMLTANSGVLYALQTELKQYPPAQWPEVIQQLQPKSANEVSVVPLAEIHATSHDKQRLMDGAIVIVTGKDIFYFGYGVKEIFLYQRIDGSDYALKLNDIPISWVAYRTTAWIMRLIALDLERAADSQIPDKIKQLQDIYHVPLAVINVTDNSVPQSIRQSLKQTDFVLAKPDASGKIIYAYFNINHGPSIVRIGPIAYPWYPQYQLPLFISMFVVIAMICIACLTYIFSRNLDKIYQITQQYSRGDFSKPPAFSARSTLYTLYKNIVGMGRRLENLMITQRNLVRFVAHESKTPIATALFAIESLEKENLTETAKKNLHSVKDDLADLNHLINDFLNYARFSEQDFKINIQPVNINNWLRACVDKFLEGPKLIHLKSEIDNESVGLFDPQLMKHVIYNLLSNAVKYAHAQIQIIARLERNTLYIAVEDDGPGIDAADWENIFTPFFKLDRQADLTGSGFGLGLSIADIIVKRHGGVIQVSSSRLGGTCFTVILPF